MSLALGGMPVAGTTLMQRTLLNPSTVRHITDPTQPSEFWWVIKGTVTVPLMGHENKFRVETTLTDSHPL